MSAPDSLLVWGAIAAAAIGTWGFRVSFVVLFGYLDEVPDRVDQALRFIPPAVIAAVVVPSVLLVDGSLAVGPANERLLATIPAAGAAWYTERIIPTIIVGMVALWALIYLV